MKTQSSASKSNKLTSEDKSIALEMAIQDFEKFCLYSGVNSKQLKVCIERERGLSLQRIALKLGISKTYVKEICDRCMPPSNK